MATKIAVVTGSNKGLGYGVVKLLLQQNPTWTVYLTARDETRGMEAVEKLKKDSNLVAKFHKLDNDSVESILQFRDFLKATHPGGIDVLVCNAGIMPKIGIPKDDGSGGYTFDDEAAKLTVQTGHFGTLQVLDKLFPLVAKSGRVVLVSSGLGQSFYAKCSPKIQERFKQASSVEQINALANEFTSTPIANLLTSGWMVVDPALEFHSGFRLADVFPIGLTHLTIAIMSIIYQQRANSENSNIAVNAVCPGRIKSDMNPTGLYTPDEAAKFVWCGVDLPDNTEIKGHFISQGTDYPHWSAVQVRTGEIKRD